MDSCCSTAPCVVYNLNALVLTLYQPLSHNPIQDCCRKAALFVGAISIQYRRKVALFVDAISANCTAVFVCFVSFVLLYFPIDLGLSYACVVVALAGWLAGFFLPPPPWRRDDVPYVFTSSLTTCIFSFHFGRLRPDVFSYRCTCAVVACFTSLHPLCRQIYVTY